MREDYFPKEPAFPNDVYSLSKYTISKLHQSSSCSNIYNLRVFGIFGPYEDYQRRLISNNIVRLELPGLEWKLSFLSPNKACHFLKNRNVF